MTLAELRTDLAERIAYHEGIGDERVAGALAVVLRELDDITGIPPPPTTPAPSAMVRFPTRQPPARSTGSCRPSPATRRSH